MTAPFGLRPGEGRPVALLVGGSVLLGAFSVFLSSTAGAIFLDAFGAGALPYLYVGSAALVATAGVVYAWLESRIRIDRLLPGTLGALLVGTVAIRAALALGGGATGAAGAAGGAGGGGIAWPVVALAGFGELAASFAPLTFWAMAGRLFDVRQAKRLFGPIGAGEVAATSLGGFAAPFVVGHVGTANLLWLCALAAAGLTAICLYVVRAFAAQLTVEEQTAEEKRFKLAAAARPRLTDPYVVLMLLFAVLATVTYYFVATAFLVQARSEYPTQDALAGFLGVFTGVLSLISFAGRSTVAGPLMERFGMRSSLLLPPLAVALTAAVVVGTDLVSVAGDARDAALFFVAISVNRICMEATWDSIYKPAYLVLYQPLRARHRLWLQTVVEGVAAPLAQGLAGVCLLAYRVFVGYQPAALEAASAGVAVVWALVAALVGRRYVTELIGAVARRALNELEVRGMIRRESVSVVGLHALERRLSGDDPAEVLYCMELLDEADYPYLERVMSQLLRHPVPAIRVAALQCLERRRLAGASAAVSAALAEETEPSVRAAALGVLAMADPAGVAERLHRAAETEAPQVRVAAVAALLRYGGEKETGAARERLREMAFSTNVEDRLLAAQAIGEVGVKDLHFAVGRLLRDDDVAVCRAALKAAGQLDVAELWPRVIQRLVRPDTARAAATALIEAGPTAMPFLLAAFATPTTPRALRLTIVRLCGRIKETDGIELLLRSLNYPDAEVRRQTLRALDACRYRANDALAEQMPQLLAREVAAGAWITAAQLDVRELDLAPHVLRTFTGELEFVRERALLLLSLVYDSRTIMRCTGLILDADQSRRAYALEILDNVLPHAVKATLLPLLDDLPPERRLAALEGAVHYERLPARERLAALVARPLELCNPWSRACWIHAAGTLGGEECHTALLEASNSPSPLVAETAAWALGELAERERAAATAARTGASV